MKNRLSKVMAAMLVVTMIVGSGGSFVDAEEIVVDNAEEIVLDSVEETVSDNAEEIVVEEDIELPDGVCGMPVGYRLTSSEIAMKDYMIANDVLDELSKMTEGSDYAENEVICMALNEDHARLIAEAYSGELVEYSYGVAKINLSDSKLGVADAVMYGLDSKLALPPVEPNYYWHLIEPEDPSSGDSLAEYRSDWDKVYNHVLNNPDPMLNPTSDKYQWHHQAIHTYNAWGVTKGSSDITVAVIDSGYTPGHPDVDTNRIVKADIDIYGNGNVDNSVEAGHGTHVMGIIGASLDNKEGGAGVAPAVKLLPVKVLGDRGQGSAYDIARAVLYVAGFSSTGYQFGAGDPKDPNAELNYSDYYDENGKPKGMTEGSRRADIANMSLGAASSSAVQKQAIELAYKQGVTIVAAMGNDPGSVKAYPAGYKHVISVSATSYDGRPTSFSSLGSWADVAAPGLGIYSTTYDKNYGSMNGTSQASPIVAGACALYMSKYDHTDPDKMEEAIKAATVKAPVRGMGAGILDVSKLFGGVATAPAIRISNAGSKIGLVAPGESGEYKVSDSAVISFESGDKVIYTTDGTAPSYIDNEITNGSLYDNGEGINLSGIEKTDGLLTVRAAAVSETGVVSDYTEVKLKTGEGTGSEDPTLVSEIIITGQKYIAAKNSATFKVTVGPKTAKNKKVTWSLVTGRDDVTISSGGKVTVAANAVPGECTIRATAVDAGRYYSDFTFNVVEGKMTGLSIDTKENVDDKPNYKIVRKGGKLNSLQLFDYNITKEEGADNGVDETSIVLKPVVTGSQNGVEWTSSNPNVAEILYNGGSLVTVKAVKPGKAKISCIASDGSGKKATISVEVITPVSAVLVSAADCDERFISAGGSAKLTATIEGVYGKPSNSKVRWDYELYATADYGVFQNKQYTPITDQTIISDMKKDGMFKLSKNNLTVDKNFWTKYESKYKSRMESQIPVVKVTATAEDGSGASGSIYYYPMVGSKSIGFYEPYFYRWKNTSSIKVSLQNGTSGVCVFEKNGSAVDSPGPKDYSTGANLAKWFYNITSSNDNVATGYLYVDNGYLILWICPQSKGTTKLTLTSTDGTKIKKNISVKVVD